MSRITRPPGEGSSTVQAKRKDRNKVNNCPQNKAENKDKLVLDKHNKKEKEDKRKTVNLAINKGKHNNTRDDSEGKIKNVTPQWVNAVTENEAKPKDRSKANNSPQNKAANEAKPKLDKHNTIKKEKEDKKKRTLSSSVNLASNKDKHNTKEKEDKFEGKNDVAQADEPNGKDESWVSMLRNTPAQPALDQGHLSSQDKVEEASKDNPKHNNKNRKEASLVINKGKRETLEQLNGIKCKDQSRINATLVIGHAFPEGRNFWGGDESTGVLVRGDPKICDPRFTPGDVVQFKNIQYKRSSQISNTAKERSHYLFIDGECSYEKIGSTQYEGTNLPKQCMQSCGVAILSRDGCKVLGVKRRYSEQFVYFLYALKVISGSLKPIKDDKDALEQNDYVKAGWDYGRWKNCWEQWTENDWKAIATFNSKPGSNDNVAVLTWSDRGETATFYVPQKLNHEIAKIKNEKKSLPTENKNTIKYGLPKGYQKSVGDTIETPRLTALRELKEETGIDLKDKLSNDKWCGIDVSGQPVFHKIFPYRCTSQEEEKQFVGKFKKNDEVDSIGWVSVDSIEEEFDSQYAEKLSELIDKYNNGRLMFGRVNNKA